MSLRVTLLHSITFIVINEHGKGAAVEIESVSVSAHLPCCLSIGPLRQDFLDIYLTTFLGVSNLRHT